MGASSLKIVFIIIIIIIIIIITIVTMGVTGVCSRSYRCYGNLSCHKIDRNILSNDWADFWYHEFGINQYRVVITIL